MDDIYEIFARCAGSADKLADYGFGKDKDGKYVYTFDLDRGAFRASVCADADGRMAVSVTDPYNGEEYVALRTTGKKGAYAAKVAQELRDVLEDIRDKCCEPRLLTSAQGMRLEKKLRDAGCQLRGGKSIALYRGNRKVPGISFDPAAQCLKIRETKQQIVLDGRMDDEAVLALIEGSLKGPGRLPGERKEWIIPANPKYFDLDHGFAVSEQLYWKQSFDAKPGDLVYIYYGMPYGAIRWLCIVTESDLPYRGAHDEPMKVETLCRIRRLYRYDGGLLNREKLKELGIVNIRGARYMTQQLKDEIRRLYPEGGTMNE